MSRVRTRPTRDETRRRLFAAAARLFEARGVGAVSIDAIAAEAGFSRGAFYSNFATKDDLIVAMFEDHADRSLAHFRSLIAKHPAPDDLLAAIRTAEREREDVLGRHPLLHLELILFVARGGAKRTQLVERLRARRQLIIEVVQATVGSTVDASWAGAMILALEDGFRLHGIIDPDGVPPESFDQAISELERLVRRPK